MHNLSIVSRLLLTAGLFVGTLHSDPSFGQDHRFTSVIERQWLSIPQICEKLETAGYRHIEKIERERGSYEVRASDSSGRRVKLYVNPTTGEVFDRAAEKRRRDKGDRTMTNDRRYRPGDCNERRCRDDLPSPAPANPPAAR